MQNARIYLRVSVDKQELRLSRLTLINISDVLRISHSTIVWHGLPLPTSR